MHRCRKQSGSAEAMLWLQNKAFFQVYNISVPKQPKKNPNTENLELLAFNSHRATEK